MLQEIYILGSFLLFRILINYFLVVLYIISLKPYLNRREVKKEVIKYCKYYNIILYLIKYVRYLTCIFFIMVTLYIFLYHTYQRNQKEPGNLGIRHCVPIKTLSFPLSAKFQRHVQSGRTCENENIKYFISSCRN